MAQSDWAEEKKLSSGVFSGGMTTSGMGTQSSRDTGEHKEIASMGHEEKHHGRTERPKGENLHEGGFESSDYKNASFTSEIGSDNDPGRTAERIFEWRNAGNDVGSPRQRKISGETPFQSLDNETSV